MSLIWFIKFLQKRPSDKTIRIGRIVFGLTFIILIYYNLIYLWKDIKNTYLDFSFFWYTLSHWYVLYDHTLEYIKYWIMAIWLVPIVMWAFDICMLRKKYIKIVQIIFWLVLFYIASIIQSWSNLDVDFVIWLMWLLPIIAWITWKCITKKCLKFWEKIKKIRV